MLSRASALASSATRAHVSLRWLIGVRWGAAVGQLVVVLWARFGLGLLVPLAPIFALSGLAALTNIAAARWLARRESAPPRVVGMLLAIDTLLLTAALAFTGGALNPFSVVYLVYITLAAVVLSARWTWFLTALAACSYGLLFLGALQTVPGSTHHPASHGVPSVVLPPMDMSSHLQGMWWAFVLAASLTAYFVVKLSSALELRDRELARMREQAARSERLASLTTLAAGAAHELSTPLATIAVVTREMERALEQRGARSLAAATAAATSTSSGTASADSTFAAVAHGATGFDQSASAAAPTTATATAWLPGVARFLDPGFPDAASADAGSAPAQAEATPPSPKPLAPALDDARLLSDARLIRDELQRCRAILDRMAAQAGEPVGEMPTAVCVRDLVAEALRALPADEAARVHVQAPESMALVTVPGRGVVTALVSLLRNALDATAGDRTRPVTFTADVDGGIVRLTVRDRGPGMTPDVLARVGEPFFSTKPAGAGMGLGLFLTRALAERLGGALRLESRPGDGTAATLELPMRGGAEDTRRGRVPHVGVDTPLAINMPLTPLAPPMTAPPRERGEASNRVAAAPSDAAARSQASAAPSALDRTVSASHSETRA